MELLVKKGENFYPVSGAYGDSMEKEAEVEWYVRVLAAWILRKSVDCMENSDYNGIRIYF